MGSVETRVGKEIKKNEILMLSVSSKDYRKATEGLIEFSKKFKKACYITLNDPSDSIASKVGSNMTFIDCVSATVKKPQDKEGVIYVSSPRALTEISIALKKALEGFKIDFVIFDSVSALLVYEKTVNTMKFIHSIILLLRQSSVSTVFIILKEDVGEEVLKDLSMFVDKVVEMK